MVDLRSFEADSELVLRPAVFWSKLTNVLFDYMVTFSPEQELAEILNRVGPVIAIGKPGEPLPELGAARLYVSDADWKAKVTDMLARSRLVVIRTGSTPNLQWEIEHTMARVPRRQILLVSLGDAKKTAPFDQYFEQRFGPVIKSITPTNTPVCIKLISIGKYMHGRIISFDESLQPREEPIGLKLSWTGLVLGLMRPYRDPIQAAMRRVFASLQLPWVSRNSQTTAVLLAMFGTDFSVCSILLSGRPAARVQASRLFLDADDSDVRRIVRYREIRPALMRRNSTPSTGHQHPGTLPLFASEPGAAFREPRRLRKRLRAVGLVMRDLVHIMPELR